MGRSHGRFRLVNASDVCLYVQKTYGIVLKPGTIRQWAARRKLPRHGNRRERYDLEEVVKFLEYHKVIPRNPGGAENMANTVGSRGKDGEADGDHAGRRHRRQ